VNVAKRAQLAIVLLLAVFALLAFRLAQIQVFAADEYRSAGDRQRTRVQSLPHPRGEIRDARGVPIAYSEPGFELWAEPGLLEKPEAVARDIAAAIGEDDAEVLARFWQARDRVLVARGLSIEQAEAVRDIAVRGLKLDEGFRRVYRLDAASSHVLGFVGRDGKGLEGLEYVWEQVLAGKPGRRMVLSDARNRSIDLGDGHTTPGLPGANLDITIDGALQRVVHEEMERGAERLRPRSGAAVVMDPRTGDVTALVSWPTYLPEERGRTSPEVARNRAVQDAYEPGSTFKPLVFGWALDRWVVKRGEIIDCENGAWRAIGSRVIHDTHAMGRVPLETGLVKSSNVMAAKIGRRLGAERLHECVTSFGFGSRTGVGLPGEASGIVGPRTTWSPHTVLSVPFGQELAVTPLQLVTGYAALVNGGLKMRPRLIRRLIGSDGEVLREYPCAEGERLLKESTSAWLRTTLRRVVEEGTGKRARIPGRAVGGKTGTAQKYERDPATGRMRVSKTKYVASFVGFAPADDPTMVCAVVWDEPKGSIYGGSAAAPVVKRIIARAFGW